MVNWISNIEPAHTLCRLTSRKSYMIQSQSVVNRISEDDVNSLNNMIIILIFILQDYLYLKLPTFYNVNNVIIILSCFPWDAWHHVWSEVHFIREGHKEFHILLVWICKKTPEIYPLRKLYYYSNTFAHERIWFSNVKYHLLFFTNILK